MSILLQQKSKPPLLILDVSMQPLSIPTRSNFWGSCNPDIFDARPPVILDSKIRVLLLCENVVARSPTPSEMHCSRPPCIRIGSKGPDSLLLTAFNEHDSCSRIECMNDWLSSLLLPLALMMQCITSPIRFQDPGICVT